MDQFKLHIHVILRHILDKRQHDGVDESLPPSETGLFSPSPAAGGRTGGSSSWCNATSGARSAAPVSNEALDFNGPKLVEGVQTWVSFHRWFAMINFNNKPLYWSLVYRMLLSMSVGYVMIWHFARNFYILNISGKSVHNPIFVFITLLAGITVSAQMIFNLKSSISSLGPLLKILNTPQLCFLSRETLLKLGDNSLTFFLMFQLYNCLLFCMVTSKDLSNFASQFTLLGFFINFIAATSFSMASLGYAILDLYIRSAFAHWLLALRSYLEDHFRRLRQANKRHHLHLHCQRQHHSNQQHPQEYRACSAGAGTTIRASNCSPGEPLTFDQIQRQLNNMDDHLEAWRNVQVGSMVLMSLNAFLCVGSLLLLGYHLLADRMDFYHGFLIFLLSINYNFYTFLSYAGDRVVFYALESFVQAVEDEFILQSNPQPAIASATSAHSQDPHDSRISGPRQSHSELSHEHTQPPTSNAVRLVIRKQDVLFCHEFLHQFENHLATPWSKLTFKSHLHMLRTFVTLVAAQIIFDHQQ